MHSHIFVLLLLTPIFVTQANLIVGQQAAAARGVLRCRGEPAAGINVKMYDHFNFDPNDKMAGVISQSDGSFNIAGHKRQVGSLRPDIKIYHNCTRFSHFSNRCSKVRIPEDYVIEGSTAQHIFDMGTLDLGRMKDNC